MYSSNNIRNRWRHKIKTKNFRKDDTIVECLECDQNHMIKKNIKEKIIIKCSICELERLFINNNLINIECPICKHTYNLDYTKPSEVNAHGLYIRNRCTSCKHYFVHQYDDNGGESIIKTFHKSVLKQFIGQHLEDEINTGISVRYEGFGDESAIEGLTDEQLAIALDPDERVMRRERTMNLGTGLIRQFINNKDDEDIYSRAVVSLCISQSYARFSDDINSKEYWQNSLDDFDHFEKHSNTYPDSNRSFDSIKRPKSAIEILGAASALFTKKDAIDFMDDREQTIF